MRIQHRYITFDKNKRLTELLDKLTIRYKETEKTYDATTHLYALEFYLYEDNPRFTTLKEAVEYFEIAPQVGTIYEKDDIEKAEWFIAGAGAYQYPQPENNFGYLRTTFDLRDYCDRCGIGKVQNAPFRIKTEPKQYNKQFWGLHWEFETLFVRQETKNIFEKTIKGIRFSNPVLHKKNTPIEGFYQLHIDNVLDKGFDSYNTQLLTCTVNNEEGLNKNPNSECCGRIKFHHPMIGGYLFNKAVFHKGIDIALTYEYFGSGGSANRLVVVSKRFKQIVDSHYLKGLVFTPIIHDYPDHVNIKQPSCKK